MLYTKWLPYEDVLVLKKVEEMVEVYYNSSQFSNTLRLLENEFDTAFSLYDTLARFYEEILLKDEQLAYFGKKNMRKFSHMERFHYAVNGDFEKEEIILLFDYQNRDPLTNQATVFSIIID